MATAFLPLSNLFAALHDLMAWLAPRPAAVPVPCAPSRQPLQRAQARPAPLLRVLRVVEPAAARTGAGRMVISGRLADVCAELERLAAQEARGR